MGEPWFDWNGVDSRTMGIWVSELPAPTKAAERVEEIQIPGRAGSLILKEGDNVHNSYLKECKITVRADADMQALLTWLSGEGTVIFSNEPHFWYAARITNEVKFTRLGNTLRTAVVPFYVHPHKGQYPPETAFQATNNMRVYNPGTVAAKPIITMQYTGDMEISLNSGAEGEIIQRLYSIPGKIIIDSDAQIITTQDGGIWTGKYDADFIQFPPGYSTFGWSESATVTVLPRWRWY